MTSCPNCNASNARFICKCNDCGSIFCSYCWLDWTALDDWVQCPKCRSKNAYRIKQNY